MTRGIHWFRNDLRLQDNRALDALAGRADAWLPVFVVDPRLAGSSEATKPRVRFLFDCLRRLEADLAERDVQMLILDGRPEEVIPELVEKVGAGLVSWASAPTPFARRRDESVRTAIERAGGEVIAVDDHTVFGADEIRTKAGDPYSVYTPYRNEWWRNWEEQPRHAATRVSIPGRALPLVDMASRWDGAAKPREDAAPNLLAGGERNAKRRLREFLSGPARRYHEDRDRPDVEGTSRLSPFLRFGAISPRRCFSEGLAMIEDEPSSKTGISKWLDELIWREFYNAVLFHSPHVLERSYRPEYDDLQWSGSDAEFEAWCEGRTGYPFVDAGMRQLKETGWMHNRVRMVVASFLTKDLLIDWRRGERFFFDSLVDGDPASNNGGWQWSASTGTDAQPYFRIFNPVSQGKRFDPDGVYVRRWVEELRDVESRSIHTPWEAPLMSRDYPSPIVDHAQARKRALEEYERVRATRS